MIVCSDCGIAKPLADYTWRLRKRFNAGRKMFSPKCACCREKRRDLKLRNRRICTFCKVEKPTEDFSLSHENWSASRCKECMASIARERKARSFEFATHFTCSRCKAKKPREEFSLGQGRRDYRCKQCLAFRAAEGRSTEYGRFMAAKAIARRRHLSWSITREEYAAMRSNLCFYCGHPLPLSGIALDRKDPDGHYTPGNVVPCCMECNLTKSVLFSVEEMLVIGAAICSIKNARSAHGTTFQPRGVRGWGRPKKYSGNDGEHSISDLET